MVRGPDGLWYRAASYDTEAECREFLGRLKPALAARPDATDNLLTISFSNPQNERFVIALGYPTDETIALADSLFEKPAITLSQRDISFALQEVTKLRRGAGVSDHEASDHARKRLQEMGASPDVIQRVLADYRQRGAELPDERELSNAIIRAQDEKLRDEKRRLLLEWNLGGLSEREYSDRLAALGGQQLREDGEASIPEIAPGTPVKITPIPFIIGYRDIQAQVVADTPDKYRVQKSEGTHALETAMNAIIARKLKRAEKYQFSPSAIAMLNAVLEPAAQEWQPLTENLWLEFTQALNTPHGENIRALWVHDMNVEDDIKEVVPASRDLFTHRLMLERNALYKGYWSFNVINGRCHERFDFTYEIARERFVYLYSHVCPYGECTYPVPETRYSLGECKPCLQCRAALAYWASVLHTSIRIIRREFALAPDDTRPYPLAPASYVETVNVKVGKGKNARRLAQEKRREVDYRLVGFEVAELLPASRAAAQAEIEREESAALGEGKRANWLKLAGEGAVIWEYRKIDTSRGRTLDPARNPRWKNYQHIEIAPFKKWVPMLARERRTIKRVTARRYAQDTRGEKG